jgi:hypothetical protein
MHGGASSQDRFSSQMAGNKRADAVGLPLHCRCWANSTGDARLNISNNRWMPLSDWAQYRYVAHVDGISCSSRLEKLLALGSLVAKEDSGYR